MTSTSAQGIVILGHPRSGTTLTRRLLNTHSNIASPPETHLLTACARFLENERTATGVDIGALAGLSFAGIEDSVVLERLRAFAFEFLDDYARRQGKQRWAEKTAFDAFHIPTIETLCGDRVKFVGIVRHPLDVALSTMKFCETMGFYPKDLHRYIQSHAYPVEAFAQSWLDVSSDLLDLSERAPDRCALFRYEDLVASPERTLTSLLHFVGEELEPQLLTNAFTRDADIGFGDHKSYQTQNVHADSIGQWRKLPDHQISALATRLNPTLARLGYELIDERPDPSVVEARVQYRKGMELVAKRNASQDPPPPTRDRVTARTPVRERRNFPRVSVFGTIYTHRSDSYGDHRLDLSDDDKAAIWGKDSDPAAVLSASMLVLLNRIGEDNAPTLAIRTTRSSHSKPEIAAFYCDYNVKPSDTLEDVVHACESRRSPLPRAKAVFDADLVLSICDDETLFAEGGGSDRPANETSPDGPQGNHLMELSVLTDHDSNPVRASISFNRAIWPDGSSQDRTRAILLKILGALARCRREKIRKIEVVTDQERALYQREEKFSAIPASVIEQVMEQVAERADHPAIVFEGNSITYLELGRRVCHLSRLLRANGVEKGHLVAICLNRSINLAIALLAVLHSGGTYVPVDPDHPQQRISQILEDSAPQVILTEESLQEKLGDTSSGSTLLLNDGFWDDAADGIEPAFEIGELAYVIFTSGSTGRPKGVEVLNHGLSAFMAAMAEEPGISSADRLLSVTTVSFDIAALEIFLPLITGATLYIARREDAMNGQALQRLLADNAITFFQATPATYHILLLTGWQGSPGIKLLCGGEAMPPELAGRLLERCSSLWNMYGPTETTIWSTVKEVRSAQSPMPIGSAIRGTRTYVLTEEFSQVPVGVPGELYIAGEGVAKGYHDRPELTAERFLPDAFSAQPGARMYRTGDLVRMCDNGDLVYLGRLDNQVKIRGFRIELGDIEAAIKEIDTVSQCVVGVFEQGNSKSLVAYVVAKAGAQALDVGGLQEILIKKLPEYMIPAFLVYLDSLPLTPNNKVDRKALPPPRQAETGDARRSESKTARPAPSRSAAPSAELQDRIIASWQRVTGIREITPEDSFVRLGGDSLSFVQVSMELEDLLGELPSDWERLSIRELAGARASDQSLSYHEIDTSILIRAFAISSIVLLHALPQFGMNGNTGALFIVAGFLFAKFQFPQILDRQSVAPIATSAWRIFLPSTLIMGSWLLWKGEFRPDVLLLYSNFTNPVLTYWYVQVLLQILLVVSCIFAIRPMRAFAASDPLKFGLILLSISALIMAVSPAVELSNIEYRKLPTVRLWQFVAGWCIYFASSKTEKIAIAHLLILISGIQFVLMDRSLGIDDPFIMVALGILLLTHEKVSVVRPLHKILYGLAGASLFIFLTHRMIFAAIYDLYASFEF